MSLSTANRIGSPEGKRGIFICGHCTPSVLIATGRASWLDSQQVRAYAACVAQAIGIVSLKGGVGKTLIAVHLAHYLHQLQQQVLLIDGEGVHGSVRWNARGEPFPFPVMSIDQYDGEPHRGRWMVFDTPAHPSPEFLHDLRVVIDRAIIPVTLNLDSLIAAEELFPYMQAKVPVRTLVTDVAPALNDGPMLQQYLIDKRMAPYDTLLPSRKAYEFARLEGKPVYACNHRSRAAVWSEFTDLGKEIVHGQL